jgi:peptidoglycan/LPS O-acetylase OafA/YrhL
MRTDDLMLLAAVAGGLMIAALFRHSTWRQEVREGWAALDWAALVFGLALLVSLGALVLGGYWLWEGYVVRQIPGAVLVSGGAVGLAVNAGTMAVRRGR